VDKLVSRQGRAPEYVTPQRVLVVLLVVIATGFGALSAVIKLPALLFAVILGIPTLLLIVRYPFVGLLLYLGIFLYRPGETYLVLAPLRLEFLLGGFLLIVAVVQQRLRTGTVLLPSDRITLFLALFFGAMAISLFASYEKTITMETCRDFGKTLVFFLLIVFLVDSPRKLYAFLFTYSLMTIKIAADSLIAFYSGTVMTVHGVDRIIGATSAGGDPNTLATTMVVSLPLVFVTGRWSRRLVPKGVMYGSCGLMLVLIALTGSRGGVLALLSLLLFATVLLRQRTVIIVASLVVLPLVWNILPTEYKERYQGTVAAKTLDEASSGRWEIWKGGLNMIVSRPLTGVGAGAFSWAGGSRQFGSAGYMQAHNLFIDIAATTGLIGLTVWLLFLGTMVHRLFLFRGSPVVVPGYPKKIISQGLLLCLSALLISGLFGHNTYRYHWYLIAALTVVMMRDKQMGTGPGPASRIRKSGVEPTLPDLA